MGSWSGPEDFETLVPTEEEAYKLAINYFLEENERFEAYKKYELQKKKTYSIRENLI